MAYRTTYLFIPRNSFLCPHSSGVYLFHPSDITKTSRSLEALRLQPLGRTTAVFSMVLGFILSKTLCPQRHSKVCFELLETFWVTPKRTCLSVICSSVVGQLRWKEYIKKYKKFLIFLIDNLDFIFLCKIRNNDRTIEYII